ncbi:hypothetical protein [uncultured Jatrophihabitans sp.]|uniref:hypothetical protein n=1 Tax=uncultured Jatrophihabitans sp. TaxID=1610747 RepID=UPI0035CAF53A
MKWSDAATSEARAMLRAHGEDLYGEAERVAERAYADTVSAAYVRQAAANTGLRQPSNKVADVALAVGPMLTGIGAGVGVVYVTSADPIKLGSVGPAALAVALLGVLLDGIGIALKLKRR